MDPSPDSPPSHELPDDEGERPEWAIWVNGDQFGVQPIPSLNGPLALPASPYRIGGSYENPSWFAFS